MTQLETDCKTTLDSTFSHSVDVVRFDSYSFSVEFNKPIN